LGEGWRVTGGKTTILLSYPGNWPTPDEDTEALFGVSGQAEGRRILPERIDEPQESSRRMGVREPWGQSPILKVDPSGDRLVLESIRRFNRQFGRPTEDTLFGRAGVVMVARESPFAKLVRRVQQGLPFKK